MFEADSHLKMLPASILDIHKYLSTLICCKLAYSSSLEKLQPLSTAESTTLSTALLPSLCWRWLLSCWHCQLRWHCHPFLCWHHCPHHAGMAALVMLASLPLLHWCCRCLWRGLPCHPWLSTCQLNEGKNACESTARCKHNKGKEACTTRALMPVHQG